MKAFAASILLSMLISFSIITSLGKPLDEPSIGVKEGNWMEYNVKITGNPPAVHRNVTWMRIDVLSVQGDAFPVNLTVRYANGTMTSSIWKFNFTAGNVGGWIIIPANLGPEESFYDAFSKADKNIAILGQEQKTILGANRALTYANDSYRNKVWDKTTGVFVQSTEIFRNWSSYVTAINTNMWSPQILGLNPSLFFTIVAASTGFSAMILFLSIFVARRKSLKKMIFGNVWKRNASSRSEGL